jgi:tubulin polyglutamylase TTLL6/13
VYGGSYVKNAFEEHFKGPEEGEDWDVLWTHRPQDSALADVFLPPRPGQRLVNHCNYFGGAGNKCKFSRLTANVLKKSTGNTTRHLRSYDLSAPEELSAWQNEVAENPEHIWVLKPCFAGNSQGVQIKRGTAAIRAQEKGPKETVAQEYLQQPFLGLEGRKFHLRIYILVERYAPAVAHLYNKGIVFRSRHEYAAGAPSTQRDVFSSMSENVEGLPLTTFWQELDNSLSESDLKETSIPKQEAPSKVVWERLQATLAELLQSDFAGRENFDKLEASRGFGCFDILGADVLIDKRLWPLIMEVNVGPNMWIDSHGEEEYQLQLPIKEPMISQIAQWAALKVGRASLQAASMGVTTSENADDEEKALKDFTRFI